MAELLDNSNRQLIPRWHTSRKLEFLAPKGEGVTPTLFPRESDDFRIVEKTNDWLNQQSLINALELFTAMQLASEPESKLYSDVRTFLLKNRISLPPAVRETLEPELKKIDTAETYANEEEKIYDIISILKSHVRSFPQDSLSWSDLAFYYSVIGEKDKALTTMRISSQLSNSHPIITRAFSRMLVNQGEPEHALQIIKRTGKHTTHPELMSAEISIRSAFDIGKPNVGAARNLIEKLSGKSNFLSELSAAIGTIELQSGARKKARKYLEFSTLSPTENTIAQLKWIAQKLDYQTKIPTHLIIKSLEADAITYYQSESYTKCRDSLVQLHNFQPFSKAPLADSGYISLVALDDPDYVIKTSEYYMHAVKSNFLALNNYIVALLESGQTQNIEALLLRLKGLEVTDDDRAVRHATLGMYEFKTNNVGGAVAHYKMASDYFRVKSDQRAYVLVQTFNAIALGNIDQKQAAKLLREAEVISKRLKNSPELMAMVKREKNKLMASSKHQF